MGPGGGRARPCKEGICRDSDLPTEPGEELFGMLTDTLSGRSPASPSRTVASDFAVGGTKADGADCDTGPAGPDVVAADVPDGEGKDWGRNRGSGSAEVDSTLALETAGICGTPLATDRPVGIDVGSAAERLG